MDKLASISIAVIIVLVMLQLRSCAREDELNDSLVVASEEASIWQDKFNRSNAEISVLQLQRGTFEKYHAKIVDSLKAAGIKIKNVEKIVTVSSHTTDTVTLVKNKYVDRWTNINLLDSNTVAYSNKDSLALVTHHKKFGFLNLKSKYVTQAIAFNPNTTLTGITSTEVVPKVRRINLGIYTGYGLTLSGEVVRPGLQVGIGLQYRIF